MGEEMALSIPRKFVSVGHLFQEQVAMLGEDLSIPEADCFVLKKVAS